MAINHINYPLLQQMLNVGGAKLLEIILEVESYENLHQRNRIRPGWYSGPFDHRLQEDEAPDDRVPRLPGS